MRKYTVFWPENMAKTCCGCDVSCPALLYYCCYLLVAVSTLPVPATCCLVGRRLSAPMSIVVLSVGSCEYATRHLLSGGEETVCSNVGMNGTDCQRPACWETYVGQQFYKHSIFDLLTQAGPHACAPHSPKFPQ